MKLTSVDRAEIAPGELLRWHLGTAQAAHPVPVAASENERFHLDSVRDGGGGWLAITLELPGRVDDGDLSRAFDGLVRRHQILRCHFQGDGDSYHRVGHDGDAHHCEVVADDRIGPDTPAAAFTEYVVDAIAQTCSPLAPLPHYFAAVRRPGTTTVICAFDHCYVDAYSLALIAEEIVADIGGSPREDAEPTGGFLGALAAEQQAPAIDAQDTRLAGWGTFLEAHGWQVPDFPVELGAPPGEQVPARTDIRTVFDATAAEHFDAAVRSSAARTYPALLTAAASAIRRHGGPAELATILPVHTRRCDADRRSVGWMVANAPMSVLAVGDDLGEALRENTARLERALPLADIGLTPVYLAFGELLRSTRRDVFMISYVDYRKIPMPHQVSAQHISSGRLSDNAQWWFWRDHDGIHLRTRYPDTEQARVTMDTVLADVVVQAHRVLDDIAIGAPEHRTG